MQIRSQWRGLGDECLLGLSQIIQESGLDPKACSSVGACGLGQFMPATWRDMMEALHEDIYAPRDSVRLGIEAYAYYQGKLDYMWRHGRAPIDAHKPGLGSYNGGPGSILKAQKLCNDATAWDGIAPCLPSVTGPANAKQTTDYVARIFGRWKVLEAAQ